MSFFSNLSSAWRSLREQRNRSLLSATGLFVASVAIVLLISIAKGVQKDLSSQIEDLGVNLLVVMPFQVSQDSMFMPNAAGMSYLTEKNVAEVSAVPGVQVATPLTFVGGAIENGDRTSPMTFIIATGPEWFKIRPVEMAEGRTFGPEDFEKRVTVIGSIAKEKLIGPGPAVGKPVTINGVSYRVIGVTRDNSDEKSLFEMGGFENIAYIPFSTFKIDVSPPQLHRIMIQTDPAIEPKTLISSVETVLGKSLRREMYSVATQEDLQNLVFKVMGILTWLLTGLTSIALFVGGVGIMTVMLMSVNERAKEIGVRKTVGAQRRDIFSQFLCESVILALLGGAAGLAFSWVVCQGLEAYTPIRPMITGGVIALCFGFSLGVGAIFGLIPALNAARKDPVISLRSE
ncbi:MAG TPA: ABC transporter permease [Fimbriimonadaceae bacterium]|nr:ABC transporter permease [Fimbriimonadaceae bacterium]HRJ33949.1 ABC transporter permease [Fimbriimonadaceae bacterium]